MSYHLSPDPAYLRPSGLPVCLLGSRAVLLALFCGICVSDYDVAAEWYVRLLGAEPSFIPNDIEAVWELADDRSIYIVVRPEGAGHSVVAIFVDVGVVHNNQQPPGATATISARSAS